MVICYSSTEASPLGKERRVSLGSPPPAVGQATAGGPTPEKCCLQDGHRWKGRSVGRGGGVSEEISR